MARSVREERPASTRPSARWTDAAPHLVALRGRAAEGAERVLPATGGLTVSLQVKILLSYLVVGAVLLFAVPLVFEHVTNRLLGGTIVVALTTPVPP